LTNCNELESTVITGSTGPLFLHYPDIYIRKTEKKTPGNDFSITKFKDIRAVAL
jgi:hypothetical protein